MEGIESMELLNIIKTNGIALLTIFQASIVELNTQFLIVFTYGIMSFLHNVEPRLPVKHADEAPSREPQRGCKVVLAETGKYPKFEYDILNGAIRMNFKKEKRNFDFTLLKFSTFQSKKREKILRHAFFLSLSRAPPIF